MGMNSFKRSHSQRHTSMSKKRDVDKPNHRMGLQELRHTCTFLGVTLINTILIRVLSYYVTDVTLYRNIATSREIFLKFYREKKRQKSVAIFLRGVTSAT